jgi:RNA methyltransferase, TrmH family
MLSKNTIKYIQSLYQKKNRVQENVFVVEGNKMVAELLVSDFTIKTIYATPQWQTPNNIPTHLLQVITADELKKISSLQTPQQVLAVAALPVEKAIETIQLLNKWTLVLDNIQDPGNLGTIIRLADWYGIENIVCSHNTVDCFNPKTLQATMGSFARVQCHYTDVPTFLQSIQQPIYGALLQGENIYQLQAKPGCIVIGNEGSGISKEVLPFIKQAITIPKKGKAESLNAAMATSIIVAILCK